MHKTLSSLVGISSTVISLAICAFYLSAFFDGAHIWFGWQGWWVAVVGVFAIFLLGPLGMVAIGVIGCYAAYYDWGWSWIACLIVFFPGTTALLGYIAYGAASSLLFKRRDAL